MPVITFSRVFPKGHPRAEEKTWFVEKIWKGIWDAEKSSHNPLSGYWEKYDQAFPCQYELQERIHSHEPKLHTIREGNRFKVGDKFSPRVWSAKPYHSKMIQFAPELEVKKVWNFEINDYGFILDTVGIGSFIDINEDLVRVAKNDGLEIIDFMNWFKKVPFTGQIICWSDQIEYP